MAYFNIDQLAPVLGLQTQQIQRMAEREQIPAQKVGGEWRFSRKGVLEWIQNKIGEAGDQELKELEKSCEILAQGLQDIPLSDLIFPEAIKIPLTARSQGAIVREMVEVAMGTNLLWDNKAMEEAVLSRENMYPTAMENGVALLHPRHPMADILGDPFIAFGRVRGGVYFATNGIPSDIFFLICSVDDTQHVRTLARLSRMINAPEFLSELRLIEEPKDVVKLIRQTEESL
ncbi:MAG: PTS sugar transporter subunit IIA [Planctomycetia bacterium]|nr:PTS sugar transporter subunit IIA [Planctomycetia bacterium]